MIDHLFQITLSNIFISLVLAIVAVAVGKTLKHPVITYLLWLLVFLKLLTPPFFTISVNPAQWLDNHTPPVQFNLDEQPAIQSTESGAVSENKNLPSHGASIVSINGKYWLLIVWGVGSMAVLIWSIIQIFRFHSLLKKESEVADPKIQSKAVKIAINLGLNAVPIIQITSANISPMVWWVGMKVWIVIPSSLIKQMAPEQFEYILSHELAHVYRKDYMIRWIEWVVCVCFWWNPVAWWARYNLRASEELCCDALVLASMKPKPYSYGDSLLKAIEILNFSNRHPSIIASGINNGKSLKRRVKMIISNELIKSKLRWLQMCIILGGLIILPLGLMNAQDLDNNNQSSTSDETTQTEKPTPKNTETVNTRNSYTNRIGDHHIVIVSTDGSSTTNSTSNNDSLYFDDGNCSVQFKDEILTVNGEKYYIQNKSDSIYVENNHVKVNGKTVSSKK